RAADDARDLIVPPARAALGRAVAGVTIGTHGTNVGYGGSGSGTAGRARGRPRRLCRPPRRGAVPLRIHGPVVPLGRRRPPDAPVGGRGRPPDRRRPRGRRHAPGAAWLARGPGGLRCLPVHGGAALGRGALVPHLGGARPRGGRAARGACGASRRAVARRLAAARSFSAWATRAGVLATDVAARLEAPRPRRHLPEVLDPRQAAETMRTTDLGASQGDPVAVRD